MFQHLANCPACPLRNFPDIQPEGNTSALIATLGEGPGAYEESCGRPFVGPSGRVLDEILSSIDLAREDLWITNAGLVWPREVMVDPSVGLWYSVGQARDLSIKCCSGRLYAELARVNPKVVVALGAKGYKQLTRLDGMAKYHGSVVSVDLQYLAGKRDVPSHDRADLTYVVPLYHPAFLLRGKNQYYVSLLDGFKKARRLAEGGEMPPCEFRFITPAEADVDAAISWFEDLVEDVLRTGEDFAVDVESTGKNARAATLTIVGFGFQDRRLGVSIAILVQDFQTKEYLDYWSPQRRQRVNAAVARLLASRNTKWYHNYSYDVTLLERYFTLRGPVGDTIILHHLYQPDLPHDLGWVAMQLLDIEPWKALFRDQWRKGKTTYADELTYNGRDALYTGLAVKPLIHEVRLRNNIHLVGHQLRVAELARQAHIWGIPIDLRTWFSLREKHIGTREEALAALRKNVEDTPGAIDSLNGYIAKKAKGKPKAPLVAADFNPLSPNHARWFLYDHLGLEPIRFTAGGAAKREENKATSYSAKGVVEYLGRPLIKEFVQFSEERAYVSALDTIFGNCDPLPTPGVLRDTLELARVDGFVPVLREVADQLKLSLAASSDPIIARLHPSWNTTGQKGTRFSSRPNVQNWEKELKKISRLPPGRKWVGADAAQIEYRIAACLAGIPALLEIFNQEPFDELVEPWKKFDPAYDAHSLLAVEVYGETFSKAVETSIEEAWREISTTLGAVPASVRRPVDKQAWRFFAALGVLGNAIGAARKGQSRLRTFVKRVVYALFYGATVDRIFVTLMEDRKLSREVRAKITRDRVAEIVEGFGTRFPEWQKWVDRETIRVQGTHGNQVIPPFGRRRWYPMAWKVEVTKIRNTPIQVSAGDVINHLFCQMNDDVREEGLDAHFAIHGHDACYWDVADPDVPRMISLINERFDYVLKSPRGHSVRIYGRARASQDLAGAG